MTASLQGSLPRRSDPSYDRRLRWRRRSDLLLLVVDAVSAVLTAWVAFRLRFEGEVLPGRYVALYQGLTVALALAWPVAARAAGLYRRGALRAGLPNVEPAFEAALVVGLALLVVNAVGLHGDVSRAWVGLVTLGLMLVGVASRGLLRHARRALVPLGVGLERYAVVGEDAAGRRLVGDLTRAAGAPYRVVATLPSHLDAEQLARRAVELRLDGLVLPTGGARPDAARLSAALSGAGIDVLLAPAVGDLDLRVGSIAMLHGVPLLRAAGLSPRRRAVRQRARPELRRGVAILGTRGIPAGYGGFETFAERLALHLVGQGVPVTVYCRSAYASGDRQWRGIRLVTLPTIRNKYLDTVVHTFLSTGHLLLTRGPRDVVLCNAANAPVLPLLRAGGRRVVLNVDGLEWRRGKWGVAGRSWYRMGEWLSVRLASVLVTDAEEVRTYYRVRHDTDSVMIPYGADLLPRDTLPLPEQAPVPRDGYVLYVSRWETENNPLLVARAHASAKVAMPLVMLGKATYDETLEADVRAAAAPHAVLPGAVYGDAYQALQAGARCYVHATEVGGTHPALIEALGAGNLCLVLDTPENREVAGPTAWFFADADELAALLRAVETLADPELAQVRVAAREDAASRFSWPAVGGSYLALLRAGVPSSLTRRVPTPAG